MPGCPVPLLRVAGRGQLGRNLWVGERQERVSPENLQAQAWVLAVRDLGWESPFPWEQPLPVVSAGIQELFKVRTSKLPSGWKCMEEAVGTAAAARTPLSIWGEARAGCCLGNGGRSPTLLCLHQAILSTACCREGKPFRDEEVGADPSLASFLGPGRPVTYAQLT